MAQVLERDPEADFRRSIGISPAIY